MKRLFLLLGLAAAVSSFGQKLTPPSTLTLRSHIDFLASDLLEGRDTPSRGLDIAAQYIASSFMQIGLEPGFKQSFFQEAEYTNRRTNETAKVRNVVGLLKGTDPKLATTYVVVSAHYDHLGMREMEGDGIYNGANDDASGVAGVIESARMLALQKPKRSILFVCYWGEEKGLLGSREFVKNSPVPLYDIVANINLEQIGRTDDSEGPRVAAANLTGFDYTTITGFLEPGAKGAGVKLEKHPRFSDGYFFSSDNASFALQGIPAVTVSTSYSFPDYHKVGDHADKLDYDNLAKIVDMAARGILAIAKSPKAPEWNKENAKTERYLKAWENLQKSRPAG